MDSLADTIHSEQHYPDEARLQEECSHDFVRKERSHC
jgi:hypothetical protein